MPALYDASTRPRQPPLVGGTKGAGEGEGEGEGVGQTPRRNCWGRVKTNNLISSVSGIYSMTLTNPVCKISLDLCFCIGKGGVGVWG